MPVADARGVMAADSSAGLDAVGDKKREGKGGRWIERSLAEEARFEFRCGSNKYLEKKGNLKILNAESVEISS